MALMKDNLWGIVSGSETEPRRPDQGGDVATHGRFVVRRDKALATIVLAVDTSLLYLLGEPEDPTDVWQILQDQFQRKTWANRLTSPLGLWLGGKTLPLPPRQHTETLH